MNRYVIRCDCCDRRQLVDVNDKWTHNDIIDQILIPHHGWTEVIDHDIWNDEHEENMVVYCPECSTGIDNDKFVADPIEVK